MPWDEVARFTRGWANAHELALAKQLASGLDTKSAADTGRLLVEVSAREEAQRGLAGELAKALTGRTMLGLALEPTVPDRPAGPAVACKVQLTGPSEATVQVAFSDASGTAWVAAGKFPMTIARDEKGVAKGDAFGDTLAEELAKRLVGVKVAKTPSGGPIPKGPKDKDAYTIRVENYSSLLLNGVAVIGEGAKGGRGGQASWPASRLCRGGASRCRPPPRPSRRWASSRASSVLAPGPLRTLELRS